MTFVRDGEVQSALVATTFETGRLNLQGKLNIRAIATELTGGVLLCLLLLPLPVLSEPEGDGEDTVDHTLFLDRLCPPESLTTADAVPVDPNNPQAGGYHGTSCRQPGTLANYQTTASPNSASDKSVEAELASNNQIKPALIPIDFVHYAFAPIYEFKDKVNDKIGLQFGTDYSLLIQKASYTESGHNTAASQVLRVLGTWQPARNPDANSGVLVWKTETRGAMGGLPTPRDMGFDTGSALSTANYKEMDYWGITDLYWKQPLLDGKAGVLIGHMDAGDWADQYPLLNAWTSFTNDAFYNNPTEAIPKRGAGLVGQYVMEDNTYLMAGIHDANGKDGKLDPGSGLRNGEFFSWFEYGFRSSGDVSARQNFHVHLWRQDELESSDVEQSWGMALTQSFITEKQNVAFIRMGYSEGNAAQMRRFIGLGISMKIKHRDTLGVATSWGSPPDKSLRDQYTSEVFYRVQVTQNLTMTPSLQLTHNPSYTQEEDWIYIPGLRLRMVF